MASTKRHNWAKTMPPTKVVPRFQAWLWSNGPGTWNTGHCWGGQSLILFQPFLSVSTRFNIWDSYKFTINVFCKMCVFVCFVVYNNIYFLMGLWEHRILTGREPWLLVPKVISDRGSQLNSQMLEDSVWSVILLFLRSEVNLLIYIIIPTTMERVLCNYYSPRERRRIINNFTPVE